MKKGETIPEPPLTPTQLRQFWTDQGMIHQPKPSLMELARWYINQQLKMDPSEKAKYLIETLAGGCCKCPTDSKEAALILCAEVIEALKIAGARELVVDDPTLPMTDMKMIGGIDYWVRVKISIKLNAQL